MGRLESLTSWALGRTPYENELIPSRSQVAPTSDYIQMYDDHARPRNPETRTREREMVRAANEVMQVTGIVEDSKAVTEKAMAQKARKIEETFTGLRLMEVGRATLVGGVWGVLGLRRRILIYRPYAEIGLLQILRNENRVKSVGSLLFSGTPTVFLYHVSDYAGFILQAAIENSWEEDGEYTENQLRMKHTFQSLLDVALCHITLHLRMFSILQHLNLIPGSMILPSLRSFIPFTAHSPLQLPSRNQTVLSYGLALLHTLSPMLIILLHGRVKFFISKLLYRPIYKTLPRPTGDSMFSGLNIAAPDLEYDAPDRIPGGSSSRAGADAPTLRALEGRPALEVREEREEQRMRDLSASMEQHDETSEEEEELQTATLLSFDVEATDSHQNTSSSWSAELRSANEVAPSSEVHYNVTGLTMLPTILATEGLREIVAGIIVMPLEAIMVRVIARAYQQSAGLSLSNLYEVSSFRDLLPATENILAALAIQVVVTGAVWAGYSYSCQWRVLRGKRGEAQDGGNIDD